MNSPTAPYLLRILRLDDGVPAGAGFLISHRYVLTCAHVVADALRLPRTHTETPDAEIRFDVPLPSPSQELRAKVVYWLPVHNEKGQPGANEDIALLEIITGELPGNCQAANLAPLEVPIGTHFESFGFPKVRGVDAYGQTRSAISGGCVIIEDTKPTGYFIEPGFSGAPVFSDNNVIGMIVRADKENRTAYMIPSAVLLQACFTALTVLSTPLAKTLLQGLENISYNDWFPAYAEQKTPALDWPANPWLAAWQLFQLNDATRGLQFISRLAQQGQRQALIDWVKQASQLLNITIGASQPRPDDCILLFQVEPLAAVPGQFHLYAWLWQGKSPEELTDNQQFPKDWTAITDEIQEWVAMIRAEHDNLSIELILPRDFFCCDLSDWKMNEGEILLRQLPVRLRCLKRFKAQRQRLKGEHGRISRLEQLKQRKLNAQPGQPPPRLADWEKNWRALKQQYETDALQSLYYLDPQRDISDLNDDFEQGQGLFVAFGCKPESNDPSAIFWWAIDYGAPLVVWFREHPTGALQTAAELQKAIALEAGKNVKLGDVPRHIWELQKASLKKKDRADLHHHLTILYDDFERIPDPK